MSHPTKLSLDFFKKTKFYACAFQIALAAGCNCNKVKVITSKLNDAYVVKLYKNQVEV